ncbi:MAG TPA: hypothetical protein VGL05_19585 [Kribbella sp.]
MANKQRLQVTLKHVTKDRTWTNQPREITADPEDHDAIRPAILQLARELDGRGSDDWWADQYIGIIDGLDETWRHFRVGGC